MAGIPMRPHSTTCKPLYFIYLEAFTIAPTFAHIHPSCGKSGSNARPRICPDSAAEKLPNPSNDSAHCAGIFFPQCRPEEESNLLPHFLRLRSEVQRHLRCQCSRSDIVRAAERR